MTENPVFIKSLQSFKIFSVMFQPPTVFWQGKKTATGKGSDDVDFRHEWKHEISACDRIAIRQRLRAVAQPDPHAIEGKYTIRSLYFDTLGDKALREKIDGVNCREKFRLRYYNADPKTLRLEKKSKWNGLGSKESVSLTPQQAQAIVDGDLTWMLASEQPLVRELYSKIHTQGLKPKTIVDYTREPFVYPPGNVRVTLDYDIRTGLGSTDFLNSGCTTVPAGDALIILEVKWDEYLPDIIRNVVQLPGRRTSAFSKYAICRIYG